MPTSVGVISVTSTIGTRTQQTTKSNTIGSALTLTRVNATWSLSQKGKQEGRGVVSKKREAS